MGPIFDLARCGLRWPEQVVGLGVNSFVAVVGVVLLVGGTIRWWFLFLVAGSLFYYR